VRVQLKLFAPTGPYAIGSVQLHLVDHSRRDPWTGRPRELMVSVWYPASSAGRFPSAPWMPQVAGALFLNQLISSLPTTGPNTAPPGRPPSSIPLPGVRLPVTQARQGAAVDLSAHNYPVVLYQPGFGDVRALGNGLVSDLASRGYIVVTMDDTYEAAEVAFPGGRIVTPRPNQSYVDSVRIADARFVLNELASLASGRNPDAEHRTLPNGLSAALDLNKVGMFGHSLGGATAAKAMAADRRIGAGINLDGSIFLANPALQQDIHRLSAQLARQLGGRAFMTMTHQGHDTHNDPSLAGFWSNQRGWRLFLTMSNAQHYTYTDLEELLSQLLSAGVEPHRLTRERVTQAIGTVQPSRAVAAERAYIAAFFDLHLRALHAASKLLAGPSPNYPEIQFLGH
jgi:predicted dienelactone hydrolase